VTVLAALAFQARAADVAQLVGRKDELASRRARRRAARAAGAPRQRSREMDEAPAQAMRYKKDSSIRGGEPGGRAARRTFA
jgi:hypothetical protein